MRRSSATKAVGYEAQRGIEAFRHYQAICYEAPAGQATFGTGRAALFHP
jgi:hypothetical protein